MKVRVIWQVACLLIGALLGSGCGPAIALAQVHQHAVDEQVLAGVVKAVREATARFRDPAVAQAEGYSPVFGCMSGTDSGALGLHFVNLNLVGDPALDPSRPEIVIYQPASDGRLRMIGAHFLVFADAWHTANGPAAPKLMGRFLQRVDSPNRFGLPGFYTLHVQARTDKDLGQ